MRPVRAGLVPFLAWYAAAAIAAGTYPVLQPNEHYVKAGRATAEREIKACISSAQVMDSPTRAETGTPGRGMDTDIFDAGKPDPRYQATVERCLRNKGYNVIGWE